MFYKNRFKVKKSDTPVLVEYEAENGDIYSYIMDVGTKQGRGLFLHDKRLKPITRK